MTTALLPPPTATSTDPPYLVFGEPLGGEGLGMPPMRLAAVLVSVLRASETNVRGELCLDDDFLHSVRHEGVRIPLHVQELPDGTLRVIMGHRRLAAAHMVGLRHVPCLLVAPGKAGEDFLDQLLENQMRKGLSAWEEAGALFAAHQAGMPAKEIRRRRRLTSKQLKAAFAAHTLSVDSRTALNTARYTFDLPQLAALAEFDGDDEALATVISQAENGRFQYGIELARQHRELAATIARKTAELTAAGVAITTGHISYEKRLDLYGTRETPLDPTEHAACPGHTAKVGSSGSVTFYCADPKAYQHKKRPSLDSSHIPAADKTPAQREADTLERRTVRGGNLAWAAASAARLAFLTELCSRSTAPDGVAPFVARTLLTNPGRIAVWAQEDSRKELLTILGLATGKALDIAPAVALLERAAAKRMPLIQFAVIAASTEEAIDAFTWRAGRYSAYSRDAASEYLAFLASVGYTPAPIEQAVIDKVPYRLDMEVSRAA